MLFDLMGNVIQCIRFLTKRNGSLLDIRAGHIDFQHCNSRFFPQPFHRFHILLHRFAADIDYYFGIKLLQKRNVPLQKNLHTRILQPDCVQHSSIDLCHPGRRISLPGNICHSLGDHRTQSIQIHKFRIFHAGSKCSGCRHNRIFQRHTGQSHLCIHLLSPI